MEYSLSSAFRGNKSFKDFLNMPVMDRENITVLKTMASLLKWMRSLPDTEETSEEYCNLQ